MKIAGSPALFLQALHALCSSLHGGHLLRPLHALPFTNVILGAPTTDAQVATELADRNARVFDVLGHINLVGRICA